MSFQLANVLPAPRHLLHGKSFLREIVPFEWGEEGEELKEVYCESVWAEVLPQHSWSWYSVVYRGPRELMGVLELAHWLQFRRKKRKKVGLFSTSVCVKVRMRGCQINLKKNKTKQQNSSDIPEITRALAVQFCSSCFWEFRMPFLCS